MDNTKKFTGRAKVYESSRPGYPEEFIISLNLKEDMVIADIGSGTGKLSAELLKSGAIVYCVEPNDDMRNTACELLSCNKNLISVNGSAEDTGLDKKSIDLITVAQALHWFDAEKFKEECKRILKDGKKAVLVWNSRDGESEFVKKNAEIFKKFCPDFRGVSGGIKEDSEKIDMFFENGYEKKYIKIRFILIKRLL